MDVENKRWAKFTAGLNKISLKVNKYKRYYEESCETIIQLRNETYSAIDANSILQKFFEFINQQKEYGATLIDVSYVSGTCYEVWFFSASGKDFTISAYRISWHQPYLFAKACCEISDTQKTMILRTIDAEKHQGYGTKLIKHIKIFW